MGMQVSLPHSIWCREARVQQWLKEEGDWVSEGAPLCRLESAAGVQTLFALESGFLRWAGSAARAGATVQSGDQLAAIVAPGQTLRDVCPPRPELPPPTPIQPVVNERGLRKLAARARPGRLLATPRARRAARDASLALEQLRGTGLEGRICYRDVEAALKRLVNVPAPHASPAWALFTVHVRRPAAATPLDDQVLATLARQLATAGRPSDSPRDVTCVFPSPLGWRPARIADLARLDAAGLGTLRSAALQEKQPASRRLPTGVPLLIVDLAPLAIDAGQLPPPPGCELLATVGRQRDNPPHRDAPWEYTVTISMDSRRIDPLTLGWALWQWQQEQSARTESDLEARDPAT